MNRYALLLLILSGLFAASNIVRAGESMDREIDYLLEAVAASDCIFIRNGKEHEPASAVDHLHHAGTM